jgi:hypothetical protein
LRGDVGGVDLLGLDAADRTQRGEQRLELLRRDANDQLADQRPTVAFAGGRIGQKALKAGQDSRRLLDG